MRPIVLVSVLGDCEHFTIDEDTTAEELIDALKHMKNGNVILYDLFMILLTERLPKVTQRKEVDYALQTP